MSPAENITSNVAGGLGDAAKAADPRRLHTAGAGWPEVPENDFHLRSEPRIQHWTEGLASRINQLPPETRTDYRDFIGARALPVVSHEIGQWCVYPNFAEMPKYTGYLKPRNFEIFQATLKAHHLLEQAHDFLIASGKLQALCYKEDIESALRTPEMGGFQLLGLNDFPGQGTALVGVLDAFWEEKGYVSPAEFNRFCATTVPLARIDKRVFTADEHLTADIEVSHFGPHPLRQVIAGWKLVGDDGRIAAKGKFTARDIPTGNLTQLGHLDLDLTRFPAPARYKLVVTLEKTGFENDWDLWVYPTASHVVAPPPPNLLVAHELDATASAQLIAGRDVLLMIPPAKWRPIQQREKSNWVSPAYSGTPRGPTGKPRIPWEFCAIPNTPRSPTSPPNRTPTGSGGIQSRMRAPMILDNLPEELRPIVQVVDDWVTNRKLGLVFEARVGKGRMLVTSIDLDYAALDPVRRQLRASLLAYAASPNFNPNVRITSDQIRQLFMPTP